MFRFRTVSAKNPFVKIDGTVRRKEEYSVDDLLNIVMKDEARIKPLLCDHFLHGFVMGEGGAGDILGIYCKAFGIRPEETVRLLMISVQEEVAGEDRFFLVQLAQKLFGEEGLRFSGESGGNIVLAVAELEEKKLVSAVDRLHKLAHKCYGYDLSTMYSAPVRFDMIDREYKRCVDCAGYRFYADAADMLPTQRIKLDRRDLPGVDYADVEYTVKNGDWENARTLVETFFRELEEKTPPPSLARTCCLELYVCLVRCCASEQMEQYIKGVADIQSAQSLLEERDYLWGIAREITEKNAPVSPKVYSNLIQTTLDVVEENLSNEHLSLRWLAGTILYTNVDYLGKLFKKETGRNFSHYVMSKRMEMAKSLIVEGKKDRIYEVAEKVGYGSNPQYFSQVFKKYTGVSPLEYKEYARLSYRKKKTV